MHLEPSASREARSHRASRRTDTDTPKGTRTPSAVASNLRPILRKTQYKTKLLQMPD
jgi:hypothetical protein